MSDVRAMYAVNNAVALGRIPRISTQKCVDCGAQAKHYDHRDYNKPLDIEPVCLSCNYKRGPAIPWSGPTRPKLKSEMGVIVGIRVDEWEAKKLDSLCKKYNMNRSEIVRWAVQRVK